MGQSSGDRLKLGKIGFLNVLPIYHPLESGIIDHSFDIISGDPVRLNELMANGHLDLSVVSSIEYARHPERYFVIPDLSISCRGKVKSVLLFSLLPVHQLASKTITVTTKSHSSVALLRILFSRLYGMPADFQPGSFSEASNRGGPPLAFLAIGDEALRLSALGIYPHTTDLGEAWQSWTGLPFVFALWVVQKRSAQRWNGPLRGALEILNAAKEWGQMHLDQVCTIACRNGVLNADELREYYACLRYDLQEPEQEGLSLFFRFLSDLGEIPRAPELEIHSPLAFVA